MIIIDANLLIYAVNPSAAHHDQARAWLEDQLSGTTPIGLPWLVIIAFLRVTTNTRVFPATALSIDQAIVCVDNWLGQPNVAEVHPAPTHWLTLSRLLLRSGAAGNLTNDAHLAAIAIDNAAIICSADNDFNRFQGVQHHNPLMDDAVHEPILTYRRRKA